MMSGPLSVLPLKWRHFFLLRTFSASWFRFQVLLYSVGHLLFGRPRVRFSSASYFQEAFAKDFSVVLVTRPFPLRCFNRIFSVDAAVAIFSRILPFLMWSDFKLGGFIKVMSFYAYGAVGLYHIVGTQVL